jgi:hypothetical protein
VLFARYTEKYRPGAIEEKRKSHLDHNWIVREDTKANCDEGQRTAATTLQDCGQRVHGHGRHAAIAIPIKGSNSFTHNQASRVPFHTFSGFCLCCPATTMSTDTDIPSLRAQLKAFEREFRATHHHAPSVDDIRNAGFGATRVTSNPKTDPWLIITP